jgi:hypothetical protein
VKTKCNSIPSVVVDLITVSRCVNNVEPKTNAIFLDDYWWPLGNWVAQTIRRVAPTMGDGLDLCSRANGFVGSQTTLGVDQMRSEDGVNQG